MADTDDILANTDMFFSANARGRYVVSALRVAGPSFLFVKRFIVWSIGCSMLVRADRYMHVRYYTCMLRFVRRMKRRSTVQSVNYILLW